MKATPTLKLGEALISTAHWRPPKLIYGGFSTSLWQLMDQ